MGADAPVVGAEGGGGEAFFVVKVAVRVIGPAVADGDGLGDLIAPDTDAVAFDVRVGPDPFFIFACNLEAESSGNTVKQHR